MQPVKIYTTAVCPYCIRAKQILKSKGVEQIDEDMVASRMDTPEVPDPDLLIRTSGEMRVSNFYLWQLAYSELYITQTLWPDFREQEFFQALIEYQRRRRRFGRTDEQLVELDSTSMEAGGSKS